MIWNVIESDGKLVKSGFPSSKIAYEWLMRNDGEWKDWHIVKEDEE